jgi:hypothetical protein
VLIGYGVAITTVCLLALGRNIPQWLDRSQATLPLTTGAFRVLGAGSFVSVLVDALSWGIISTLAILFLFFLLWTVLRSQWAAAIAIVAITSLPDVVSSPDPWIFAPLILVANSLFTLTMIRFGLVAMFVNQFVTIIFLQFPMSLSSEWYSGIGYAALLVLAALAIYGLRVSLGDRPLLNLARLED